MEAVQQGAATAAANDERRRVPGRPFKPGQSGNPSGSRISKGFPTLYRSLMAEFAGVALTASDVALLTMAARLMARRYRTDDHAIRGTTQARIIIDGIHARHKKRLKQQQSTDTSPWSPLRSQIIKEAAE